MTNRSLVTTGIVAMPVVSGALSPVRAAPYPPQSATAQRALLDQYCVGCHNDAAETGGLSLQGLDLGAISANGATWERVVRKLRAGMMPPSGAPRPETTAYKGLITSLEGELDTNAAAHLPPPRACIG